MAKVAAGAREAGVLVRPLLGGVAMSPPLICEQEHIELIADGIRAGLDAALGGQASRRPRAAGGAGTANDGGAMSR